jgi:hypothetical protein
MMTGMSIDNSVLRVFITDRWPSCIAPYKVDVMGATTSVERETTSSVLALKPGRRVDLNI